MQAAFKNVFIGPNGIRAGWRLLIFVALIVIEAAVLATAVRLAFPHAAGPRGFQRPRILEPRTAGGFEGIVFALVVIAAFVMSKIERRPFSAYGLPMRFIWQGRFWR